MIVRHVLSELDDREICHKIARFYHKTCLKICCKVSVNQIIVLR